MKTVAFMMSLLVPMFAEASYKQEALRLITDTIQVSRQIQNIARNRVADRLDARDIVQAAQDLNRELIALRGVIVDRRSDAADAYLQTGFVGQAHNRVARAINQVRAYHPRLENLKIQEARLIGRLTRLLQRAKQEERFGRDFDDHRGGRGHDGRHDDRFGDNEDIIIIDADDEGDLERLPPLDARGPRGRGGRR